MCTSVSACASGKICAYSATLCHVLVYFVSVYLRLYAHLPVSVRFKLTEIPPTSYLSARTSRFTLPLLPREGLKGSLLYFDGQMNDSRMCLSLALSPTVPGFVEGMQPAAAANHVAAKEFIKNENGQIVRCHRRVELLRKIVLVADSQNVATLYNKG